MRALNRFVAHHVLRVTSSRNEATERLGLVNRVAGGIHSIRMVFRRAKRMNRRLYYTVKYALYAVLAWLILFRGVFS